VRVSDADWVLYIIVVKRDTTLVCLAKQTTTIYNTQQSLGVTHIDPVTKQ